MNLLHSCPPLAVVGSINVDIIATTPRLPGPGETVGGGTLRRDPGGKGANQAAAAARLGGSVRMIGMVGDDPDGRWMRDSLRAAGVGTELIGSATDQSTGTALIIVDDSGENQIAVCGGANQALTVEDIEFRDNEAVLTQFEIPMSAVVALADMTEGMFVVNAAPAQTIPKTVLERADLVIVNEAEYHLIDELSEADLVAVTYGSRGAALLRRGSRIAYAPAVATHAINSVGAGDAFCAGLTLALLAGLPHRSALQAACAIGAAAVADPASQPALRHLDSYL